MKELQARNASSRFNEQNKNDASQQEEDEIDSILSQAGAFVPSPVCKATLPRVGAQQQ